MQTNDTHNRDSRYNSDLRTEVEALSRKFNELEMLMRNYLEQANDEKIKSNRRLQDTLYNLDDDNVPGLTIVRKKTFKNGESIAELNLFADETKTELQAIAKFQKDTTDSIAKITQTATEQGAKIEFVAERTTKTESDIEGLNGDIDTLNEGFARIAVSVDNNSAAITDLVTWKEGTSTNIASIESKVTANTSEINLRAIKSDVDTELAAISLRVDEQNKSIIKLEADILDIDVSDKVTIGDSIVVNSGGSFSIAETLGDNGEIQRTLWDSRSLSFTEVADPSRKYSATYDSTGISLWLNDYLGTTIESGRITTDYIEVVDNISTTTVYCDKINGYIISFDENGYLKGVKE
jgi:hypothetical protein